jgi:hypothetical protein
VTDTFPNRARPSDDAPGSAIPGEMPGKTPGSTSQEHPRDGIPLPAHGFDTLDQPVQELASYPASEVISRAALGLVNAAAEKLGLVPAEEPDLDLPDARRLITALAGLLAASAGSLGAHDEPLLEALRTLQRAFRETSAHPDPEGQGPGESLLQ